MIVFAIKEGTTIWSDNNGDHKAGRVPLHQPLLVLEKKNEKWYSIARPGNLSLPTQPNYPDYWVKKSDTLLVKPAPEPEPEPDPEDPPAPQGDVSDMEAAQAIVTLLKWMRG